MNVWSVQVAPSQYLKREAGSPGSAYHPATGLEGPLMRGDASEVLYLCKAPRCKSAALSGTELSTHPHRVEHRAVKHRLSSRAARLALENGEGTALGVQKHREAAHVRYVRRGDENRAHPVP